MLYYLWAACEAASALVLIASGITQLGGAHRLELSARAGIGWCMLAAAGLLAEGIRCGASGIAVAVAAVLLACVSAWLAWWPHRHPAVRRVTGWGALD